MAGVAAAADADFSTWEVEIQRWSGECAVKLQNSFVAFDDSLPELRSQNDGHVAEAGDDI